MILSVPYHSQLAAPEANYAPGDCGPDDLSMITDALGQYVPTDDISIRLGKAPGYTSTTPDELVRAGRFYHIGLDLQTHMATGAGTFEVIEALINEGRPIIALMLYQLLPLRYDVNFRGGHYVLIVGTERVGNIKKIVYHDPYYKGTQGAYLRCEWGAFARAWNATGAHSGTPSKGLVLASHTIPAQGATDDLRNKVVSARWHTEESMRVEEAAMAQMLDLIQGLTATPPPPFEGEAQVNVGAIVAQLRATYDLIQKAHGYAGQQILPKLYDVEKKV